MSLEERTLTGEHFLNICKRRKADGPRSQYPVSVPMAEMTLPTLPEGWIWASLSELCERVSVGHVGPTTEYFCNKESGVPFVRSQDVKPGKLHLGEVAHVTQEFHDKLKKSKLRAGDILIVRVGANRGDSCVVPKGVGEVNCANIVFARPIFPNGFLGFYFRSPFGQQMLLSLTTGAAQGVLNTQDIARLPVPCPPIMTQEKVASILSAYDDLIENNTRRIQILEEMARRIYEEWFVRFRFPGHENVSTAESELGLVPDGWKVDCVTQMIEFDPRTTVPREGLKPFIPMSSLAENSMLITVIIYLTHMAFRAKFTAWKTKDHSRRHCLRLSNTFPILMSRSVAW
jgi:type I restriction enzyme, S subunit